jgi:chemotaxis protein MotB
MKRLGLTGLAALLTTALLATAGCGPSKKQFAELEAKCHQLEADLDKARENETRLLAQLDARDAKIDAQLIEIRDLKDSLAEASKAPAVSSGEWEKGLYGDRITLGGDILFSAGRSSLTAKGKAALAKIARELKSTYAALPVRVYGHTDTDPIRKTKALWKDNLDLSANRAMEVTRYLIEEGIDPKRIETIGMGEHHPLDTKAKSRRVEIVVLKK